ncbi:MAG TPA: UDP-3-O-(3-hydroxymyristoyl)glucosamine N-acyltransferase [Candidatus Acidoferrum sp.]|nr:UDP-3-O-(3-hydroxymyristoyl)glucosamine N-acyltransferase [Candidatus Acidoferrum sp.]
MSFKVAEIAKHLQGEVIGDGQAVLKGFAPAAQAQAGDLTFAENEEFLARAEQTAATAIITDQKPASARKILIRVPNARIAFAKALALFFPERAYAAGVHPTAVVAASAQVDPTAHIGPHCVVGERVKIGARSVLEAGNFVGDDSKLADEVNLFPNVTVYAQTQIGARVRIHAGTVVGSDGFGYVLENGVHLKVPQIGNVIIGDDVEIGANVTIDRGALGPTVIGKGTKIDNLVQIAHNVEIGEGSLVIAQVGISGSTKIGKYTILAGQVGLAGHLKIGNQVIIGAKSGVMTDIPDGGKWLGIPAQPDKQTKRQMIAIQHLPDLIRRVNELERKLGEKSAGSGKE